MKKDVLILIGLILILSVVVFAQDNGSDVIAEGIDFIGLTVPEYTIDYGAMYGVEGFKSQEIEIDLINIGSLDIEVTPIWDSGSDVFKYIKFRDESGEDYISANINRSIFSTCILMDYEIIEEEYVFSNNKQLTTLIKLNKVIEIPGAQEGTIYFSAIDVGGCER